MVSGKYGACCFGVGVGGVNIVAVKTDVHLSDSQLKDTLAMQQETEFVGAVRERVNTKPNTTTITKPTTASILKNYLRAHCHRAHHRPRRRPSTRRPSSWRGSTEM